MLFLVLRVSACRVQDLLSYRQDPAMFGLGFGGFATVIERNGEAVPG